MTIKMGVIRGATEKEIKSKKFNLYVGISLGNKWFTKENIKEYILWCLKYTKNKVAVLIADTLHSINYEVRNEEKPDKALIRSIREGKKYEKLIREIISEIPKGQQSKVEIVKWDDVKKDDFNQEFIPFFFKEFNNNREFREEIIKLVKNFTKREKISFDEQGIRRLCEYIITELPELLHGFTFRDSVN